MRKKQAKLIKIQEKLIHDNKKKDDAMIRVESSYQTL